MAASDFLFSTIFVYILYVIFNKIVLSSTVSRTKKYSEYLQPVKRLFFFRDTHLYAGIRCGVRLHVVTIFQLTVFIKLVRHDRENISLIYLRLEFI